MIGQSLQWFGTLSIENSYQLLLRELMDVLCCCRGIIGSDYVTGEPPESEGGSPLFGS